MGKTFKSWSEIESYLKKQIDDVLNNEVANVVKDQIIESVDEVVYDAGEPVYYQRRGFGDGSLGLGGRSQMEHTVSNGLLEVIDNAKAQKGWDNGKSLAENIEYGYGDKYQWYNQPRPFIEHARESLKKNKNHVEMMEEGLEKRGLKVVK